MGAKRQRPNFSELTDFEVVEGFKSGKIPGREVMKRCLHRAELSEIAGRNITLKSGGKIAVIDYMTPRENGEPSPADQHEATPMILGFVALNEGDPRFPQARDVINRTISEYAGLSGIQGAG